jgi:outer membrane protein assembly factor BamB
LNPRRGVRGRRWSFDVGTAGDHTPVVAGDTVYTTGDRLSALKPDGGLTDGRVRQELVRFTHGTGSDTGPMSVADGRLFVHTRPGDDRARSGALLTLEPTACVSCAVRQYRSNRTLSCG